MEKRCSHNSQLDQQYRAFMREYEDLKHMSIVSDPSSNTGSTCYLPHHGVYRTASPTAKLRVVFNGSQRTSSGESLNSYLHTGANLLPALSDTFLRWRWHRFVIVTDIEMYRQILVHQDDRRFQTILWRHHSDGPVREFRFNTVTYGLACASFLAIRTVRQLASDEEARYPRAAAALCRDYYVDDIVTGANTVSDAITLQRELCASCMAGGFPLRKSNCEAILSGIPLEHRRPQEPHSWQTESHSPLGLLWHPKDSFALAIHPRTHSTLTKRTVFAKTARLFDPLGWLAPVVIRAKIFIQSTWLKRLDWDMPLLSADALRWEFFLKELPQLASVCVTRWLDCSSEHETVELHGFADASERGYAAVVYIRVTKADTVRVHLLAAKSKVAPLKQVSPPRLELCAATLLTNLTSHVQSILSIISAPVTLWSDSRVTLHWIRGHPSTWKTFVANWVSHIQTQLPEARWRHVPGRDNPADCGIPPGGYHRANFHRIRFGGPARPG